MSTFESCSELFCIRKHFSWTHDVGHRQRDEVLGGGGHPKSRPPLPATMATITTYTVSFASYCAQQVACQEAMEAPDGPVRHLTNLFGWQLPDTPRPQEVAPPRNIKGGVGKILTKNSTHLVCASAGRTWSDDAACHLKLWR